MTLHAQPRGGILSVRLVNGTTGGDGSAERVTLMRLAAGMVPVKELGPVSGRFEITEIEVEGERPMLLQVTSAGVSYNQPIDFEPLKPVFRHTRPHGAGIAGYSLEGLVMLH